MNVLGIMSGTSLDGVDFVLTKISNSLQVTYLDMASSEFPKSLRVALLNCADGNAHVREVARLHHDLGRFYSAEAKKWSVKRKWKVDLIGLHGQTVFHEAPSATLQIGEGSYLSTSFNVPVINDFRVGDLAVGGQGAPLATFLHAKILQPYLHLGPCAFHNLGGISNVSYFSSTNWKHLRTKGLTGNCLSFDTGPANILMDRLIQRKTNKSFDLDGRLASEGIIDFSAVKRWFKKDKYLKLKPPKSCGREQYTQNFLDNLLSDISSKKLTDQMATLAELTAQSIAHAYKNHLPKLPRVAVFSGGGSKNNYLMFRIRYHLPEVQIMNSEELGWPSSSIEGAAFALLAAARMKGLKGHLPQTTGADHAVQLGKIIEASL